MTLSDELKKRLDVMPDKWTIAWLNERFADQEKATRGAFHAVNRAIADCADIVAAIDELRERCDSIERAGAERSAEIGKLRAELVAVKDRQDKIANWIKANLPAKEKQ